MRRRCGGGVAEGVTVAARKARRRRDGGVAEGVTVAARKAWRRRGGGAAEVWRRDLAEA